MVICPEIILELIVEYETIGDLSIMVVLELVGEGVFETTLEEIATKLFTGFVVSGIISISGDILIGVVDMEDVININETVDVGDIELVDVDDVKFDDEEYDKLDDATSKGVVNLLIIGSFKLDNLLFTIEVNVLLEE